MNHRLNIQEQADSVISKIIPQLKDFYDSEKGGIYEWSNFRAKISNSFLPLSTKTKSLINQDFDRSEEYVLGLIRSHAPNLSSQVSSVAAQKISYEMDKIQDTLHTTRDLLRFSLQYLQNFLEDSERKRYASQVANNALIIAVRNKERQGERHFPVTELDLDVFSKILKDESTLKGLALPSSLLTKIPEISLIDVRSNKSLKEVILDEEMDDAALTSYLSWMYILEKQMFEIRLPLQREDISYIFRGLEYQDNFGNYYGNKGTYLSDENQRRIRQEKNDHRKRRAETSERERDLIERMQKASDDEFIQIIRTLNNMKSFADLGPRSNK